MEISVYQSQHINDLSKYDIYTVYINYETEGSLFNVTN